MKYIAICVLLVLIAPAFVFSCDRTDPICVAKTIMEKAALFRSFEIKDYYCEDNQSGWEFVVAMENYASALIAEDNAYFHENRFYDLSGLKYALTDHDNESATVTVVGTTVIEVKGTDFRHENEMNETIFLVKERGTQKYCIPIQDIIKKMGLKKQKQSNQKMKTDD